MLSTMKLRDREKERFLNEKTTCPRNMRTFFCYVVFLFLCTIDLKATAQTNVREVGDIDMTLIKTKDIGPEVFTQPTTAPGVDSDIEPSTRPAPTTNPTVSTTSPAVS